MEKIPLKSNAFKITDQEQMMSSQQSSSSYYDVRKMIKKIKVCENDKLLSSKNKNEGNDQSGATS